MNNPRYDDPNDPRRDADNPQKQGENVRPGQREDQQQQQGGNQPGEHTQGNPNVRKPGRDDGRNDQQR